LEKILGGKASIIKKIAVGLVLAIAVFIILNSGYFLKNLAYTFHRPQPAAPAQQTSANETPHAEPDMLWIDSLRISAPIQYIDQANETTFQAALKNGVVHYPGTALPGQPGNVYIFGHSSDYLWSNGHYKTIFALLPRIAAGVEIRITGHDGQLYAYKVLKTAVVAPTDTSVLSQNGNKQKLLTVQTSYPVGTALKRFVAIAQLEE